MNDIKVYIVMALYSVSFAAHIYMEAQGYGHVVSLWPYIPWVVIAVTLLLPTTSPDP